MEGRGLRGSYSSETNVRLIQLSSANRSDRTGSLFATINGFQIDVAPELRWNYEILEAHGEAKSQR